MRLRFAQVCCFFLAFSAGPGYNTAHIGGNDIIGSAANAAHTVSLLQETRYGKASGTVHTRLVGRRPA